MSDNEATAPPVPGGESTATPVAEPGTPQSRVPRWSVAQRATTIVLLALAVGGASAIPAYRWWRNYHEQTYKTACKAAVEARDWERLEAVATRWTTWDPGSSDAWVYLAEASVQLNEKERAVEQLGRVSDSYHGALESLALRGEILFSDLNRPYDAVATWKRMVAINPLADLPRQRLIYFYSMTFQRAEMMTQLREAMELGCEPPEAYTYFFLANELNFSDGLSVVSKWRQAHPDDEVLEVAQALYVARYSPSRTQALFGQSTVAAGDLSTITECLKKYPNNLEVLAFHLEYAIYDGDEARVAELLGRCPSTAEQDSRFWRYRGWYLASQGEHAEAEQAFRKSLELHPADWRTWLDLANVLRRLQHPQAAEAADIAFAGKELKRELFELPTARSLDNALARRLYEYFQRTGPRLAWRALERRIE